MFLDRAAVREEVHSPLWQAGPLPAAGAGRDVARRPGEARPRPRPRRRASAASRSTSARGSTRLERRAGGVIVRTASGRAVRADHVVVATSAYSGWLRRLSSQFVPVYDYVDRLRAADARAARGDRLAAAPGHVRREQPVPLLPADRRRPDPVGRLRRDLLPGQRRRAGIRPAAGDVRQAGARSSARAFPQLGPLALPVPLGRRDRHDDAVHGHVRAGARRPADVLARLHRALASAPAAGRLGSSATSSSARTRTS